MFGKLVGLDGTMEGGGDFSSTHKPVGLRKLVQNQHRHGSHTESCCNL